MGLAVKQPGRDRGLCPGDGWIDIQARRRLFTLCVTGPANYNVAMLATIVAAVVSFAATNIDDILLLTFFFGQGIPGWRVVAGQYLGFSALVVISLVGYFARFAVPEAWIGLLGLVPIIIGALKLRGLRANEEPEIRALSASSTLLIAATTFSNGGDNIGIYVPLFASTNLSGLILTITIFLLLLAVWCIAGYFFGRLPIVRQLCERHGHVLVPFALIGLGIYILIHNHTTSLLLRFPHKVG